MAVSPNGKIIAQKAGVAFITARTNDGSDLAAESVITVNGRPVSTITLDQTSIKLDIGDEYQLRPTISPTDATNKNLIWTSDNTGVATIDNNGNIKAVSTGTPTVRVAAADGSGASATCTVTVTASPVETITLNPQSWTGTVGESITISPTVLPETTTDKTVIWKSSDANVATVDASGTVTAISVGNCTITATVADDSEVYATCDIVVEPILVSELTLDPAKWVGNTGDSFTITAFVHPKNATVKDIEWSSSDNSIASVDNRGNVSIHGIGSCIITARTTDGSGVSAECVIDSAAGIDSIFNDAATTVDIYDTNGILIKTHCNRKELKSLSPGIYIINCSGNILKAVVR